MLPNLIRINTNDGHLRQRCPHQTGYRLGVGSKMIMLKSTIGKLGTLLLVPGIGALFATPALAQDATVGKNEFSLHCAACHGLTGLGDGPIGQMLKIPAPNLAFVAQRNGGSFPFKRVYDIQARL
jgi:hypothetical protein